MENLPNETESVPVIEERLPWHKPAVERLTVSIDTAESIHSGPDGLTHGLLEG